MCDPPSLEFRGMVWLVEVYVLVNFEDDIDQMILTLDVLGSVQNRTEMITIPQEKRRHFPSSSFVGKVM